MTITARLEQRVAPNIDRPETDDVGLERRLRIGGRRGRGLYSSRTIDNVATSLAWIASHGRTIATVDIQEPPLSTRPNMSPTREIPILAAPPQVSCRLRTLPPRQWQRSSEKFAAGNPMTTQPRSASSAAQESVRYR